MRLTDAIRKHPLVTYFVVTFLVSWSAFLAVVAPSVGVPAPAEAFTTTGAAFAGGIFALLLGPPIASLFVTAVVSGRRGLRAIGDRVVRVRIGPRHLALLLIGPGTALLVVEALSVVDEAFRPGFVGATLPALLAATAYALGAGLFEELGWTGFATPRLIARFGAAKAGLVLGVIWAIWHVLPVWTFSHATAGALYPLSFLESVVFLTSFRVLMTFEYDRTGSLLLAMLLHTSLTAPSILVSPVVDPWRGLVWNAFWPASLAVAAVIVAMSRAPRPIDGLGPLRAR